MNVLWVQFAQMEEKLGCWCACGRRIRTLWIPLVFFLCRSIWIFWDSCVEFCPQEGCLCVGPEEGGSIEECE